MMCIQFNKGINILLFLMLFFCVIYFWDECKRERERVSKHHISPCEKCQPVLNTHLCQAVQRQKNLPKHVLRGAEENFLSLGGESYLNAPLVLPVLGAGRGPGVRQDSLSQLCSLAALSISRPHNPHSWLAP